MVALHNAIIWLKQQIEQVCKYQNHFLKLNPQNQLMLYGFVYHWIL